MPDCIKDATLGPILKITGFRAQDHRHDNGYTVIQKV